MSESMITRCPKCSTTFRVTQEVLNMAKGKVRCGQCFHIFTAEPAPNTANKKQESTTSPETVSPRAPQPSLQTPSQEQPTTPKSRPLNTPPVKEDGSVNPDWLNTLFHEDDLAPYTPPKDTSARFTELMDFEEENEAPKPTQPLTPKHSDHKPHIEEELAPWELELAELDAQMSAQSPVSPPIFSEQIQTTHTNTEKKPFTTSHSTEPSQEHDEPDYMHALHSLAQDVSKHDSFDESEYSSQESIKQLAAEYNLATLTESNMRSQKTRKKPKYTWLWVFGSVIATALLAIQIGIGFFETGSRSPEFRSFYKTACAYLGCTLPAFEDIESISIEHVRIQSHPTVANTLQVNAIMTNTSSFAQTMPKLALEFYDLNGRPVAARLFAPQDYLHKDFLDITFMPPNTPIHIVIPIQDPGARAVTHQIKVFSSQTQSY
ncbi:zinc-ribbon and DUF3426 domain-containing protein [Marinomonas ostreistagni]|uniref:Zinc-ribbon domain-containing protein n=1 Tax=Marinomonas ostreistagni TaxID=359209 RepID=A0ABS0ZB71_9GAMM|nr:zinc-ribbon and DUF3426 domain-containing protein [Marinomonas ostreistagni]MBJ7550653.1 zinc-ribbon domain-containing protein [Marinomonas ostreistagni]